MSPLCATARVRSRSFCAGEVSCSKPSCTLVFTNHHLPEASSYLANVIVAQSSAEKADFTIVDQQRSEDQARYQLEIEPVVLGTSLSAGQRWPWLMGIGLCAWSFLAVGWWQSKRQRPRTRAAPSSLPS